jgi:predicted methyltransferase
MNKHSIKEEEDQARHSKKITHSTLKSKKIQLDPWPGGGGVLNMIAAEPA